MEWFKHGARIPFERASVSTGSQVLTITAVVPEDSGRYQCSSANSVGELNHVFDVTINRTYETISSQMQKSSLHRTNIRTYLNRAPPVIFRSSCFSWTGVTCSSNRNCVGLKKESSLLWRFPVDNRELKQTRRRQLTRTSQNKWFN